MKRNFLGAVVATIGLVAALFVGQALTPALSATPPVTTTTAPLEETTTPAADPPGTAAPVATTTTVPATTVPATTVVAPAPPAEQPDDGSLRPGQKGARVLALQQGLRDLGYWLGTPDGTYGGLTVQAVTAFQKVVGLERDGIAGGSTQAAIEQAGRPTARSDSGDLIEVDKSRQVLLVVRDGRVQWFLNVSTGTERRYQVDGQTELADTPPGHWQVGRVVDGVDNGPLGGLYRPRYFHRDGIAVHGYHSVPAYAASHGCVRVSEPAMDWIWATGAMPVGSTVWVY